VIIAAAPVLPSYEYGSTVSVRTLHEGVDQAGGIGLAILDVGRRMLAHLALRHDPGDLRQAAGFGAIQELVNILDISELIILLDGIEGDQRIPKADGSGAERFARAEHGIVFAIRLAAITQLVSPHDVVHVL